MSLTEGMASSREFRDAVLAARKPVSVSKGGREALVYDVSGIPGAGQLPRALVELLENVVRRSATDDDAVRQARAVVEAGLSGEQYRLIADTDNTKYKLRFKILEVFENMFG